MVCRLLDTLAIVKYVEIGTDSSKILKDSDACSAPSIERRAHAPRDRKVSCMSYSKKMKFERLQKQQLNKRAKKLRSLS